MLRSHGTTRSEKTANRSAPEGGYDFYLDEWNPAAAALQATGDLILIRLPRGFYGVIVVRQTDDWGALAAHFQSKPAR